MASKLGDRLKALRDEKGLTTADLAKAAGIDDSTMTSILAGDIERPPDRRLRGLAELLDVSFDSLLKLVPEERRAEAAAGCVLDLATAAGAGQQDLPTEILLIPAGEVKTRPHDGRAPWRNNDPEAVVAATRALKAPLPIDYDHASEKAAASGNPAPAAGWIEDVFVRDGAVWGKVAWTDRAKAHLSAREYRFFSPTFWFDRTTRAVKRLVGGALTNDPAFFMKAIASSEGASMDDEQRQVLAAKLGLTAEATVEDIAAALGALRDKAQAAGELKAVATAAGLAETASAQEVAEAVSALRQAQGGGATPAAPDPSQYVPIAEHKALASRIAALEQAQAQDKAAAAVDAAIQAGKVTPAGRDWALAYAAKDPDGFAQFVASQPTIVRDGALVPGLTPPGGDKPGALSPEEKAVCAAMGLSEDEYRKSRQQLEEKAS